MKDSPYDVSGSNRGPKREESFHVEQADLDMLINDPAAMENQFRRMIIDYLELQNHSAETLEGIAPEDIEDIDITQESQERQKALSLIGTSGAYGIEAVSSRIFEYAQALYQKDPSKHTEIINAVERGFEEAAKYVGGDFSAFAQKTYDRTKDKLQNLGD